VRIVITETRLDMKDINSHDGMEDCSELSSGKPRGTRRSREIIKDDTGVNLEGVKWMHLAQDRARVKRWAQ
jgi:hypothetical protein